jgi:3-dehydroquinate synthase
VAEVLIDSKTPELGAHIEPGSFKKLNIFFDKMPLTKKALVITDDNVKKIYGETVYKNLTSAGYAADFFCIRPGERSKSFRTVERIYTHAINMGMDRNSPFIALGGGVVGDLAGFAASTYLRGVPFINLPTTLLAQVDSSIGGKTAVNHVFGKNLIGSFYQPAAVIIDPETLKTLPEIEMSAGLSEVVKYGMVFDEQLFEYLSAQAPGILRRDMDILIKIISRCCRIKTDIVIDDEQERGMRILLNFGHTIGHAIEAAGAFRKFNHGEAVAIGMRGAVIVSKLLKLCDDTVLTKLDELLTKLSLSLNCRGRIRAEQIQSYLIKDKKSFGGEIKWVLLNDIGNPKITADVPQNVVQEAVLAVL